MTITTVYRERYTTNGWEAMAPLTLSAAPQLAWEYARQRSDGPLAPTRDEIKDACRVTYSRSGGGGGNTLAYGDMTVTRVEVGE